MAARAWLRNPPAVAVDVLVAALVAMLTISIALAPDRDDDVALALAVTLPLVTLPLLVRRRWPVAVLLVVTTAGVLSPADLPFALPLAVAIYSVGARRPWSVTLAALGAVVAGLLVYDLSGGTRLVLGDVVMVAVLGGVCAAVGRYIGGKRTSIERLSRERELLAERAVAEERVRIAQELHDVIAHNVSLIVVQAQALGATHPDVSQATSGIADLGRRTMAEMHRTLRLLRERDETPELTPQPGLADLDELLARSRAAGVRVELAVEGAPRRLAQSVDLSAFRIVQEALTNVVKHAGGAPTAITIAYGPDALELTIADRGNGAVPAAANGGHGLIGMRERTALFGGSLTAGPRPDSGFEVRASLPYDERVA